MKNKALKALLTAVLILSLALLETVRTWPDEYSHLVMCDVGQGDAILITQGFKQMLIDTGVGEEKISHCLDQNMPFWDRNLEYLVITHDDKDHSGAREYIEDSFFVEKIIDGEFIQQNPDFVTANLADQRKKFSMSDNIWFQILWPTKNDLEKYPITENESSVTLLLHLGEVQVLLTGDINQEVEQALLERGLITDIDILKVAHHGSKSSSSLSFLKEAEPEECLISLGENNSYGHPHNQVLDNLTHIECEVSRTDQSGSIELLSDGQSYWFLNK
jgi:competence protein ComEC